MYDKLQRLSFRFFDDHASGSIINRVTGDVQSLRSFVDMVLIQVFILALQFTLICAYMMALHFPLTVACLSTTPLLAVGAAWFSRVVRPAYVRNRELVDKLIGVLSENVQGALVVKGFAREREEIEKFAVANREVRDQQRWIFWRVSSFIPSLAFLSQVNLIVLLAYGGWLVMPGTTRARFGAGGVRRIAPAIFQSGAQNFRHRQQRADEPDRRTAGFRGARYAGGNHQRGAKLPRAPAARPRRGAFRRSPFRFQERAQRPARGGFLHQAGHLRGDPRADRLRQKRAAESDPAFLRSERGQGFHR